MSDINNEQILDKVRSAFDWADDVSEKYTGTVVEKIIDLQKQRVKDAVDNNDLEMAQGCLTDLIEHLEIMDKEYMRTEG